MNKFDESVITVGIRRPFWPDRLNRPPTIQEMRIAIHDAKRHSALVHRCFVEHERSGSSTDELMTMLAYYALYEMQSNYQYELRRALMDQNPPNITVSKGSTLNEGVSKQNRNDQGTTPGDDSKTG